MRKSLFLAALGVIALGASAHGQITKGVAGNQTQVPGQPGMNTFGGLLGRPGNAPPVNNVNPGEAAGNPANNAGNGANTVNGAFNPLGAFGTQFAPQLPNGNTTNGSGMTVADIMRMRMMQSMGSNRRGTQTGAPIWGGNMGPQMPPGMNPANGPMAPANNNAMPLFNAQAQKEAERAKARQRAEDIRTKEAEARERRKAKALEAKKKAEEEKAEAAAN